MKYKVGDKVIIKTWKKLERDYGLTSLGNILPPLSAKGTFFAEEMEEKINKTAPDRILTIEQIKKDYYYKMEEITRWGWCDYMIEGLITDGYTIFDPIGNRFELMDFE